MLMDNGKYFIQIRILLCLIVFFPYPIHMQICSNNPPPMFRVIHEHTVFILVNDFGKSRPVS